MTVLLKYCDIFLSTLPTWALPNLKLGDIYEILLVEGAAPIRKFS